MLRWLNDLMSGLARLGFWRVMAVVAALLLLAFTLMGPSDPSLVNAPRRH